LYDFKIIKCSIIVFKVPKIIYANGCLDKFEDLIGSNVAAVGGVGCGIAFLQVRMGDQFAIAHCSGDKFENISLRFAPLSLSMSKLPSGSLPCPVTKRMKKF
jgi:hypothetical protein